MTRPVLIIINTHLLKYYMFGLKLWDDVYNSTNRVDILVLY
jgi:hypothetical protein